ncbi:hypothetical protein YC2023_082185 [Brassica napus]
MSAHMAYIKGKGILYEDDDEPIKLTDQDDSHVIKEYHLSLIGKVSNLKKQNVEKLLQTMPTQWGVQDRVTANDLGNGKFLINFTSEEDLNSVLRKGPFHYNYCMFDGSRFRDPSTLVDSKKYEEYWWPPWSC